MTTGSWSIGDFGTGDFAASKQWVGGNGKYESWGGGIRAKWNNYEMLHRKMTQNSSAAPWFPTELPFTHSMSDLQTIVGWSDNDVLRLLNKLAGRVRGHSFDLGINIAEGRKSYGTILSNLRSIGSALLSLKHGNIPEALRTLGSQQRSSKRVIAKDFSARWLETQYAFLPLVSQSYEAAKALKAITGPRRIRFRVSSGAKRIVTDVAASTGYKNPASFTYSRIIICDLFEDLSLNRSLQLTNPAAIAWEVVPYSFVVDWFLPIGSYLSAWGVIPALSGRFLTVERGACKSGRIVNNFALPYPGLYYEAAARRETFFRIKRTISSSLSVPFPTFNTIPKAMSAKRILNAIGLIHQRLR